MTHVMPILPYEMEALAPQMSKETLEFHYGKHLQTYVDNLNRLIVGTPFETSVLDDVVRKSDGAVYNNAAQVWNHTFFFDSLVPGGKAMSESLQKKMAEQFGSADSFVEQFTKVALGLFGSGWVWLVRDDAGKMSIIPMGNAGNPLTDGLTPLLTLDVWEHAYYIDYRNRRADFVKAFWNLVDWDKVEKRYNG